MNERINPLIFRAYDIRGIWNDDLNEEVSYLIGRSFGTILRGMNKNKTIVGYDNRESSIPISKSLINGILESGIDVVNVGLVTSPMCYFAADYLKINSYIMITASHNPGEYNGFKISYNAEYNAFDEDIKKIYDVIQEGEFTSGNGKLIMNTDIKGEYLNLLLSNIKLGDRKLKVVYDCGNGTTSIIAEQVFNSIDINEIGICDISDPTFPNHHPDPSVEENLQMLKDKVIETKADFGVAFDGDGDRIGVVDENGLLVSIEKLMIIFWRDIEKNLITNRKGLYDVKCSKVLEDELIKLNIEPICYKTGSSYTRWKIVTESLPFGGEYSGHICFNDKFPGYDDGIYVALRLIELMSNTSKNISELLTGINTYYNTNEIKIHVEDSEKTEFVEEVKEYCLNQEYKLLTIDGVKVLFDDGFALIRASNTGPNIIVRYEANTIDRLKEIEEEFNNMLDNIGKTI